jgi:hypothetical protein
MRADTPEPALWRSGRWPAASCSRTKEWIESARRRMIAGEAPHLGTFFLSHRYGRPKDQDAAPDRPPILFVSAYGPPGSYDPLAREARADTQPIRRGEQRGSRHAA